MNPTLDPIERARIIQDATADARAMVFVILAVFAFFVVARLLRWLLDVPKTHLQRVARALEADSQPKYLHERAANRNDSAQRRAA